jgi:hypothetical protein
MNILSFIVDLNSWVSNFFALISKTTIFGLPLDTTLHVVVGFLITYIGLKLKYSFLRVFIFLLIVESIKAYYAALTIEYSILHGIKEFIATFVYPAMVWLVRKIKTSKNQSTRN